MANNSVKFEFDLSAVKGLQDTLAGIAEDVRANVVADMVHEGAKPVVRSIKRMTPVRLGNLRESITSAVRKNKTKGTAVAVVGPEVGARFASGRKLNKKTDDLSGSEQPARYAHLVEFGNANRGGGETPAKPFMRPGTDAAKSECAAALLVGFQKGLTRAAKRYAKQSSK